VACDNSDASENQGAVGISFWLHDTSLCFIASHLTAHLDTTTKLSDEYTKIINRMRLGRELSIANISH
jgi:hypothetical protein